VSLFGAPIARRTALRAAQAALALRGSLPHVQSVSCGLTCDRLFAATVGSPMRRAYAIIGDSVNLAARLMSRARPDEILADVRALARWPTRWPGLRSNPIRVKGKSPRAGLQPA
jgi:class 3 adenylate cyclase